MIRAVRLARFLAVSAVTLGATAAAAAPAPVVRAPAGAVRGVTADGERVFKGIPYARPPIAERRWRAPEPLPAWRGVRDAAAFGPACMQVPYPAGSIYSETYPAMSEDCLTLNVWAPANAKHAPVFFWVHGGSLLRGSSQESMFDGAALAKRGILVVSINYRLGVLGYFAHPELSAESPHGVSGNYGLLDQIAALHWVQRNIAAFGGDPHQVTIAGESAGALSMLYLLASPQSRGLFERAIVQSANLSSTPELKVAAHGMPSAESAGARFAAAAGAKSIADLRAMDSTAIVGAAQRLAFAPTGTIDSYVLRRQLVDTFDRGEQARVPVLTGFNSGEIRSLRRLLTPPPADAAQYEAAIRANYGPFADTFLKLYPSGQIDESMLAAVRDLVFGWTSQRLVRSQTAVGMPAYLYFWDHGYPAGEALGLHGFHASEVQYVFGTLRNVPADWPKVAVTPAEQKLSTAMLDYWASFARTGRPVAAGQPAWLPFKDRAAYMLFTDAPHAAFDLKPAEFALNEQIVCRRRAAGNVAWNWNIGVASPPLPPAVEQCR